MISLLVLLIPACMIQIHGKQKALIGYELYSWQDTRGDWVFCLLPNTSSEKTVEVVFDEKRSLHGIRALEQELATLPRGEHIFWLDLSTLTYI